MGNYRVISRKWNYTCTFFLVVGAHLVGSFFSRNLDAKKKTQQTNTSCCICCVNLKLFKSKVFKDVFQPWMHQKKGQEKPITPLATVECFKQWYVIAVQQLRRTSKMFIFFSIHFHASMFFCQLVSLNNKKYTQQKKQQQKNPTATTAMKTKTTIFQESSGQQWATGSRWSLRAMGDIMAI